MYNDDANVYYFRSEDVVKILNIFLSAKAHYDLSLQLMSPF